MYTTTLFHQIRKWNGHYYQAAALWQVRVKLYLGHEGKICTSRAATNGSFVNELYGNPEWNEADIEDEPDLLGDEAWDSDDMNDINPANLSESILPIPPSIDSFGSPFIIVVPLGKVLWALVLLKLA